MYLIYSKDMAFSWNRDLPNSEKSGDFHSLRHQVARVA
jgi:hypothetical protein